MPLAAAFSLLLFLADAKAQSTLILADTPQPNQVISGAVAFSGWALDAQSSIAVVSIQIDGANNSTAQYGSARPDVCSAEGQYPGCPSVGWSAFVDSTQLPDGPHLLAVNAVTSDGRSTTIYIQFSTNNSGSLVAYEIVNKLSGKVLDVTGASPSNGTIIQQWDFNGGGQQKWLLVPVDSQNYKIVSQLTGKVLDVTNASTSEGAIIQEFDDNGGDNQRWQFIPAGGGYFRIVSKLDGQVLDDSGGSTTNGSYIQQWPYSGGDDEQWRLAADGTIPVVEDSSQSTNGHTSDGSVSALSILTVSGGTAFTYSQTELDYSASLYYDPYTVGSLFDNGADVTAAAASNSGSTPAAVGLSAPVYPWHDYQLESDHWIIAWFATASGYYDPFGFSEGPYSDGSGDATFDATGVAVWLTAEYLYLGSTIADQTYVPQDLLQNIPTSDGDNTVYVPSAGIPTFQATVDLFTSTLRYYLGLVGAATAIDASIYGNQSTNRVPLFLSLAEDYPCNPLTDSCATSPERVRRYFLKDSYGRPWNYALEPVQINEALTQLGGTYLPAPSGSWSTTNPNPTDNLDYENGLVDTYGPSYTNAFSIYLQRYYASLFSQPASLFPLSLPGFSLNTVPLLITSPYTPNSGRQGCTNYVSQLVQLKNQVMPSVNGDAGPPADQSSYPICKGINE